MAKTFKEKVHDIIYAAKVQLNERTGEEEIVLEGIYDINLSDLEALRELLGCDDLYLGIRSEEIWELYSSEPSGTRTVITIKQENNED